MANRVFIATSLDGYIARPDGSLDWLTSFPVPSQGDYGFDRFMEGISAIVMGRNTYETVLTFGDWPYSKPVVVLSSTLERIPDHLQSKVTLLQGHPREITSELNARGAMLPEFSLPPSSPTSSASSLTPLYWPK